MVHCVVAASFLRNMHIAIESIASNNICSTWREEGDNVAGGLKMHNLLTQVGILEVWRVHVRMYYSHVSPEEATTTPSQS